LALDGPADADEQFNEGGFSFCINKELLARVGGVTIDMSYMGFTVNPAIPLQNPGASSACGGCAGSTSCSV
jgi:Fe-S cluster assembly iron-binding protein IscA